jgi:hypothetical protein
LDAFNSFYQGEDIFSDQHITIARRNQWVPVVTVIRDSDLRR